jgi:bla regulator protein blaR1
MTNADLSPLANHLWQSTVFAAAMWALTLPLKQNRAAVRYWLWLAASVKFLVPFSLLVSIGSQLGRRTAPMIEPPQWSFAVEQISHPFTASAAAPPPVASPAGNPIPAVLLGIWLCGIAVSIVFWLRCWRQMRTARQAATPFALDLPIPVLSSSTHLEPGVFGIYEPVLLLPEGITEYLTSAQLATIVTHEMCHVRRRDNLTAAIHMVVEVLFWFYPLVWWIRARLIEERELACDEEVLKSRNPDVYAEGILNVCKFCLESRLICMSGIIGSNLKRRISFILAGPSTRKLNAGRKLLLTTAGIMAVAGPILVGLANAPSSRAQSQGDAASRPAFEVASVKLTAHGRNAEGWSYSDVKIASPGRLVGTNASLDECIRWAYDIKEYQISRPDWLNSDAASYDIEAKAPPNTTPRQMRLMLQTLLGERFKLVLHRETKLLPVYWLKVGKNGPHLQRTTLDAGGGLTANGGREGVRVTGDSATMETLAHRLSLDLDHPVFDKTGIQGTFWIRLEWAREGDGPSVFAAVQEQLGLKLEASKAPIEILVIDHAERMPTEN